MSTTIAANALPSTGFRIKLAVVLGALTLAAIGLAPTDVPLIGELIGDAHAGTNDDSI